MEKYNNIVYISKIQKCMETGEKEEALRLVEKVNLRKIKDVSDLNIIAETYYVNKYYTQAKELYEQIYGRTSSKRALSRLINVSIKIKAVSEAEYYLGQYENVAGNDSHRWIYRYQLERMSGSSAARLIEILEKLKEEDYYEKWAYELAKLYHKCGRKEDCINECKDIILWFGEGEYVEWAKTLIGVLTGEVDIKALDQVSISAQQPKVEEVQKATETVEEISEEQEPEEEDIQLQFEEEEEDEEVKEKEGFFKKLIKKWKKHIVDLDDSLEKEFDEKLKEEEKKNLEQEEAVGEDIEETLESETTPEENDRYEEEMIEEADEEAVEEVAEEAVEYEEAVHETEAEYDTDEAEEELAEKINEVLEDNSNDSEEMGIGRTIFDSMMQNTGKYQPIDISDLNTDANKVDDYEQLAWVLKRKNIEFDKVFGIFADVNSVSTQLKRTMNIVLDGKHKNLNLIITGPQKSGKTALAKRIITLLHKAGELKSNEVARTTADKVNKMKLEDKLGQLADKAFLIENAGSLSKAAVEKLIELNPAFSGRTIVILEDNARNINTLLRDNPELNGLYNHRIHLPISYTEENMLAFVHRYISDKGYNVDMSAHEQLKVIIAGMVKNKGEKGLAASSRLAGTIYEIAEERNAEALCSMAKKGDSFCTDFTTIIKEDMIKAAEVLNIEFE